LNNYSSENNLPYHHFKPDIDYCIKCNNKFVESNRLKEISTVYCCNKSPLLCLNSSYKCKKCERHYYKCYYIDEFKKRKIYFDNVFDMNYIAFTSKTYFEQKYFDLLTAEIIHMHATFKGKTSSYNSVFHNSFLEKRGNLEIKRVLEYFFYFHLIRIKQLKTGLDKSEFR
jgi:hypothetical protein